MASRHHVILVTGLARAGKTTLMARIYAEATRLTSQRRDYQISFPYLTLSGEEESALAYIQERWEWVQNHFDARCKTLKEEPVYMDVTYHAHTTRFVIYDAPGEAFSSRLSPGESEIEAAELARIKKFLKERLSSRHLDAAMVVVNAEQLLSAEGHKSTNFLTDFLTAAKIGEFGTTGFPIMVVVTHCGSAGVNHEKLQRYLLGGVSREGRVGGGTPPLTAPEEEQKPGVAAKGGVPLPERGAVALPKADPGFAGAKPGPMDFYKDLAVFCVDTLFDLKKDPVTNKYELPSSRNTSQTATQLTPITAQGTWLSDPGAVFSELMQRLERRCRRRRIKMAVSAFCAAVLIVGGSFLADAGAYQWAVHQPSLDRLEGYLNRSKLWPFKRYTAVVGAAWARLNTENLRGLVLNEEGDNGLRVVEECYLRAERAPCHKYLDANPEWSALSERVLHDLKEFNAKAHEKRRIWPAMAHQNWAGFLDDYNASLRHLRAYVPALERAKELKDKLNSEHEAEELGMNSCIRAAVDGDSMESLQKTAALLEKQTCEFTHNRPAFDGLMEKTADQVWQLRDQGWEPALDALQKLRKNSAASAATAKLLDERIGELRALRDNVTADWAKMEAEVEPLLKSEGGGAPLPDWKEALTLLKNKQNSFRAMKRLAVEVERQIADLEKRLAPAEERYAAAREKLSQAAGDLDKRVETLNDLAGSTELAPERRRQFAAEKQEVEREKKDLEKLYSVACETFSRTERDRSALPRGLDAIQAFRDRLKGQGGQTLSAWGADLDGKEKRLRSEKARDDAIVVEAAAFLAAVKIEANQSCLDSFRSAGRRIRDALATYRVADATDLRGEWVSKLKSCIEKTLVPSNTREGFKAALGLVSCAEEFDPAQKGYAAATTDDLRKSWAAFEWSRVTQETQHAVANADYPAALAAVQKYRSDGEPFEKRIGDADKLWDEVVTEWNDKFFARLKRITGAVHDQAEFDNKMSQVEDRAESAQGAARGMPPEAIRSAALRELIGRQRETLCASYNQLVYGTVSDRVKKLDRGIIQSWDELDAIDAACKEYMEDRRIPADSKSYLEEVKKLHNRLDALRAPATVRIESFAAWGTRKNFAGLYTFTGAYFAPVILRNQDALFTVSDTRKGAETKLDNLLGWKDAYPMDHAEDAGADINLPVIEDKFDVKKEFRLKPGDKLVVKVYSSKDPARLDEKMLLLNRELDFKKLTPGYLVAHPNLRFEGAMEGDDPELRKGKPAAGMILSITLPDGDRWKL